MIYQFKESSLGPNFHKQIYREFCQLIKEGSSFTLISIPGAGATYFLRYFSTYKTDFILKNSINFVFVDVVLLYAFSKFNYFKLLYRELGGKGEPENEEELIKGCQKQIEVLLKNYSKIVIIFNRFDLFKSNFDKHFLTVLKNLRGETWSKVVMIFTANKPIYELAPESMTGSVLPFYSKYIYFGTYNKADLINVLKMSNNYTLPDSEISKLIPLSGYHSQLLQLLVKSENPHHPLFDKFINLQLKDLYNFLSYAHKQTLQKIAQGKKLDQVDPYLLNIGIVKEKNGQYEIFTPLLAEYIKQHTNYKIPAKEGKLFKFLKGRLGQVVSKDEIFDYVWVDNPDLASDWALNALIYRLRKNPGFKSGNYVIESYKKLGYSLLKEA